MGTQVNGVGEDLALMSQVKHVICDTKDTHLIKLARYCPPFRWRKNYVKWSIKRMLFIISISLHFFICLEEKNGSWKWKVKILRPYAVHGKKDYWNGWCSLKSISLRKTYKKGIKKRLRKVHPAQNTVFTFYLLK